MLSQLEENILIQNTKLEQQLKDATIDLIRNSKRDKNQLKKIKDAWEGLSENHLCTSENKKSIDTNLNTAYQNLAVAEVDALLTTLKAQDPAEDIDLNEKYQTFMTQVKAIADDYREFDQTQSTLQGTIVDKQTQAFDYLLDQKQRKFDESMTATPQLDSLFNTLYQDMIAINEINLNNIRDDALGPLSEKYIKFYSTSTQRILQTAQDQVSNMWFIDSG